MAGSVVVWALVAATGCAGEVSSEEPLQADPETGCVPGLVASCGCSDGSLGLSVCDEDYQPGPCTCPEGAEPVEPPEASTGGTPSEAPEGGEALDGSGGALAPTGSGPDGAGSDAESEARNLARDVRIAEVAAYQPVKVSLVRQGEAVIERNAPVIAGKPALIRVFIEPLSGFQARDIEVELTLSSAESGAGPTTAVQQVSAASRDEDLRTTVNFDIPGDLITTDVRYAVALREVDGAGPSGTADPAARFPVAGEGLAQLGARSAGPLRVLLVPYRYAGDGSNRLPAVDSQQLEVYRDEIYARYPVSEIELEVREPVTYTAPISPQTGWPEFLDAHCRFRTEDNDDPKVLYYGLIAPRESLRAYGGGIMGISYLPGPAANYGRCSVGVGFASRIASTTMAHELGHSLGLPHAPCGVEGGPFPYAQAKVGVWGVNRVDGDVVGLVDPDEAFDLMSYCEPNFISDYNFQKLFERVRYLNLQFSRTPVAEPATYVRVLQHSDGTHAVTGRVTVSDAPAGPEEARPVTVLGADGRSAREVTGYFLPSSEAGSGLWLVPDTGAGTVRLDGGPEVALP